MELSSKRKAQFTIQELLSKNLVEHSQRWLFFASAFIEQRYHFVHHVLTSTVCTGGLGLESTESFLEDTRGWREDLGVKSTDCSSRGRGFNS